MVNPFCAPAERIHQSPKHCLQEIQSTWPDVQKGLMHTAKAICVHPARGAYEEILSCCGWSTDALQNTHGSVTAAKPHTTLAIYGGYQKSIILPLLGSLNPKP